MARGLQESTAAKALIAGKKFRGLHIASVVQGCSVLIILRRLDKSHRRIACILAIWAELVNEVSGSTYNCVTNMMLASEPWVSHGCTVVHS